MQHGARLIRSYAGLMSLLRPSRTDNPEHGGGRKWRGPNLALLSVALAFAITISVATAGAFPPEEPYSTMLLLLLAAALIAVLKP
jgi:hypothetical protein